MALPALNVSEGLIPSIGLGGGLGFISKFNLIGVKKQITGIG